MHKTDFSIRRAGAWDNIPAPAVSVIALFPNFLPRSLVGTGASFEQIYVLLGFAWIFSLRAHHAKREDNPDTFRFNNETAELRRRKFGANIGAHGRILARRVVSRDCVTERAADFAQ